MNTKSNVLAQITHSFADEIHDNLNAVRQISEDLAQEAPIKRSCAVCLAYLYTLGHLPYMVIFYLLKAYLEALGWLTGHPPFERAYQKLVTAKQDADSNYLKSLVSCRDHQFVKEKLIWISPFLPLFCWLIFPSKLLAAAIIASIVVFSLAPALYGVASRPIKEKLRCSFFGRLAGNQLTERFADFVRQVRPFFLFGLVLTAPVAIPWMAGYYLCRITGLIKADRQPVEHSQPDCFILRQEVQDNHKDDEANFYNSPAFAWTMLLVFGLGLPAALTYAIYNYLNIDALLGYPSHDPEFRTVFIIIDLYLYGIAWAFAALFFRAYFCFPLNFLSTEHDIEVNELGIFKRNIKGWFADLLCWGYRQYFPQDIKWEEIKSLRFEEGGVGRLSPLPPGLFSSESVIYKILNAIARYTDATIDRIGRVEFVTVKSSYHESFGGGIKVRLSDLSAEDKARFFYAVRKWAPWAEIPDRTQLALIGSSVLRDAKYTQIWYDLLTQNANGKRPGSLCANEVVHKGKYKVIKKLDSGGQAVAYLAETIDGESPQKVVLKEFILATGEGLDALVESASNFENESSILSQLAHPNIVKLEEVFIEDNRVYLALEFIEGTSLRHLIGNKGPLAEAQVLPIALQLCDMLIYLSSLEPPVVHRDFTPDNLILMPDGTVKLIDFSISQRNASSQASGCAGKHPYTPPEQFRGEATPQSDIYALGGTLHFLFTGKDPVPVSQSRPRESNASISEELNNIVSRATALDPSERFESATWLKLELAKLSDRPKKPRKKKNRPGKRS